MSALETKAAAGKLAQLAKATPSVVAGAAGCESVLEPKLDGWRLLAEVAEGGVRFYSRGGKRYDGKLPHVARELAKLPVGTWIDGEAVAIDFEDGDRVAHRWSTAQSVLGSGGLHPQHERITFVAFDLIALDGHDARPIPFRNRRSLLERALAGMDPAVQVVTQYEATDDNLAELVGRGYEGGVVKHLDSRYSAAARGAGWFKIKEVHTEDVRITGFREGTNGLTGQLGALEYAAPDGTTGVIGSGITDALRAEIDRDRAAWLGRVVEVAQKGAPGDNHRPASLVRVRLDREPEVAR